MSLTPAYQQVQHPDHFRFGSIDPDRYYVFVLKSRVHFRRGFYETGYAPTVIVTDLPGDWFGTTRLGTLPYRNGPIHRLYPFAEAEGGEKVHFVQSSIWRLLGVRPWIIGIRPRK